ncbi:MAG TPA: type II 3-dehydroquinate dehydratase [Candidatus Marinimicrobia bacterium]|nr:type II 3-dehydroquinate dehydratase [Candidatus Neomarinimicrobiota bacterium]
MAEKENKRIKIMVIHGPNLNLLGLRDPKHYGNLTLDKLNRLLRKRAAELGVELKIYQFNDEGRIITALQRNRKKVDGVLINPAAYTHYSIAIRDTIELLKIPVVEVHLSNIYAREDFRTHSVIKDFCAAQFYGKKEASYTEALAWLVKHITETRGNQ